MRLYFLSLILFFSTTLFCQDKALNGKWWLESIILTDTSFKVEVNRFYLIIDQTEIMFNKEKNKCGMNATIKDGQISDCKGACTKVCCDDWYGNTSQYFNVNGSYQISQDTLFLINKYGLLRYIRSDD